MAKAKSSAFQLFFLFFSKASMFLECPSSGGIFFLPRFMWSHFQLVVAVSGVMCAPGALARAARAREHRVWASEHRVWAREHRVWAHEHKV